MLDFKKRHTPSWIIVPLVAWIILMLIGTSIPGNQIPEVKLFSFDKVIHFALYAVLGGLLFRYFYFKKKYVFRKSMLLMIVCVLVYGVLDEFHQYFIPNRSCAWQDMLADAVGAFFASLICYVRYRLFPVKEYV